MELWIFRKNKCHFNLCLTVQHNAWVEISTMLYDCTYGHVGYEKDQNTSSADK